MYEYLVNTQRHLSNLSYRKQFDRLHRLRYYWPNIDGFCNYSIKHQVSQLLVDVRFSVTLFYGFPTLLDYTATCNGVKAFKRIFIEFCSSIMWSGITQQRRKSRKCLGG